MYNYSDTGFFTSALYTEILHVSKAFDDKEMCFNFLPYIPCYFCHFDQDRKNKGFPSDIAIFYCSKETSKGLVNIYNLVQFCTLLMALSNISGEKKTQRFLYLGCLIFK